MASEITVQSSIRVSKGYLVLPDLGAGAYTIDMAGTHYTSQVQQIGITHEAIVIGADVATLGVGYFRNNDTVNSIEIGIEVAAAFYPTKLLKPGEKFPDRLVPGVTYYAKASATSGAGLQYLVLED